MLKREGACLWETIRYRLLGRLSPLMLAAFLAVLPLASQTLRTVKERKLITRVEPEYPAPLKRLNIGGVARIEVLIAPNGTVKGTTLLGGSPYLGQTAMAAIKEWRYAPARSDQTLIVTIEFDPHR